MTLDDKKPARTSPLGAVPGLPELNVDHTLATQTKQLQAYRELLELLAASEQESAEIYPQLSKQYLTHVATLTQLKDDLQNAFTRIRALKVHFKGQYPDVFEYVQKLHMEEDEYEHVDNDSSMY
ncbi:hypothetical protein FBU59_002795 [Linderina macrospora]|uniref:Uncharacterized protein n=1 Tax=Linderina macrospora TaxID=4868 RepID=A0ACC1JA59_9FUNG|nr:hypothetical protein FBU59_002795 [Linderina macrospora]